uniref:Uncharacterized protein n=1 Tax=Neogobius melanostomus TaxID=47308 RepID=A0A8C6TMW6_9GOBI
MNASPVVDPPHNETQCPSDRRRQKTRVNIGEAFEKWKILREYLGMTKDPQLASFLLESNFPISHFPFTDCIKCIWLVKQRCIAEYGRQTSLHWAGRSYIGHC